MFIVAQITRTLLFVTIGQFERKKICKNCRWDKKEKEPHQFYKNLLKLTFDVLSYVIKFEFVSVNM